MIIQTTEPDQPHFAIEQRDHARMCGSLALAFAQVVYQTPMPEGLFVFTVAHHDEGWVVIDERVEQSPVTGLPYHLTQTPLPYLLQTSKGSPDFNEERHAYCGLLSSMHTVGLFNGRYGLSDFVFIDRVPAGHKADVEALLAAELARQARLRHLLEINPATKAWVEQDALFTNYKLLQFFDTLALYFHLTHGERRKEGHFLNVPTGRGLDKTVTITPQEDGTYCLIPWCFPGDSLEVWVEGRYMTQHPAGTNLKPIFEATAKVKQIYRLVAGRGRLWA